MQAVHVLDFYSVSFSIPANQNMLLAASISVDPGCPKFSALTTTFYSSSGITFLSLANSRMNRSLCSVNTGEISSGFRSFWLLVDKFSAVAFSDQPKFLRNPP